MRTLLTLTAAAVTLLAGRASAAEPRDEGYFTVNPESAIIEELPVEVKGGGGLPQPPTGPQINGSTGAPNGGITLQDVNNGIDTLDRIVNLIDKIMTIIAKNQPVVNINVNYANAVPFGTTHWTQLQGWSRPATRRYAFRCENLYGMEVVKVVYQVHWTHSGNFNGVGKFLTGVTVEPISVETAWGYNVDLTAEVPDSTVANVGTSADPIASMQVQLKWKIHTIIKDMQEKSIFYVQGDGHMEQIGDPHSRAARKAAESRLGAATRELTDVRFN